MVEGEWIGGDTIGKATLLTDLFREPRPEAAGQNLE